VYALIVARRMKAQSLYEPVFYDWAFHVIVPFVTYLLLIIAAILAQLYPAIVEYVVAASGLILLFIGIHNAWDGVSYHVFVGRSMRPSTEETPHPGAPEKGRTQ